MPQDSVFKRNVTINPGGHSLVHKLKYRSHSVGYEARLALYMLRLTFIYFPQFSFHISYGTGKGNYLDNQKLHKIGDHFLYSPDLYI